MEGAGRPFSPRSDGSNILPFAGLCGQVVCIGPAFPVLKFLGVVPSLHPHQASATQLVIILSNSLHFGMDGLYLTAKLFVLAQLSGAVLPQIQRCLGP